LAALLIGEQQQWQDLYPFYILLSAGIIVLAQRLKAQQARH
jgi:hypothetical protein